MSKYIDREALVAEFKRLELGENSFIERVFADGVYAIIEQFPAADVAPVVRCKDCKYRDGTPGQPNILCAQMHEDDFCSYGERRAEKEPPEEGET
nr:MAG TPA: hypothetical protein [Caudoviricetes sp.]